MENKWLTRIQKQKKVTGSHCAQTAHVELESEQDGLYRGSKTQEFLELLKVYYVCRARNDMAKMTESVKFNSWHSIQELLMLSFLKAHCG